MFETEQQAVEGKIREYCAANGLPEPSLQWTWIPFSGQWGISTSFFQLAAQEARQGRKGNVPQRAQEIAESVKTFLGMPAGFERLEAVKGYLNLYFSTAEFARRVIDTVLDQDVTYGRGELKNKRVMVEYSQPNTHKSFHVGHLRTMFLGAAISNILEFAGYEVVRANYIGDIGLHVIKWLWNYQKYHNGEEPPMEDVTRWMGDLYADATRHFETDPEAEAEVRALFARWDQHDPDLVALWEKTRGWSLEGFNRDYASLGIRFDRIYYESEVEEPGKELVKDLIARGIAKDERPEGPVIIKLDELLGLKQEKYHTFVILRSDGTSLYSTKEIPLAIKKFEEYDLDKSIYVIDVRQSLHIQQIFKTLELMGYPWADRWNHLAYEIVNMPGNVTMSSREGTVVLLEDLIKEATSRALAIVQEKNPELERKQQEVIARAVAIGAIKYSMLARENTKIVTFDWETALDFNGQAAPYIQYAHVRANSILRKAGGELPGPLTPTKPLETAEIALIDQIARFSREVQRSAADLKTLYIASYAYDLAKAFNDFYNQCPVLQAEPEVRANRLRLVAAARQAVANSLALLGITAPQAM